MADGTASKDRFRGGLTGLAVGNAPEKARRAPAIILNI